MSLTYVGNQFPFYIPSIYKKDEKGKLIIKPNMDECPWVFQTMVLDAYRLLDGENAHVLDNKLYVEASYKKVKRPANMMAEFRDSEGVVRGWIEADNQRKHINFLTAFERKSEWEDGNFILVGLPPYPERDFAKPTLVNYDDLQKVSVRLNFVNLNAYLVAHNMTGILFKSGCGKKYAKILRADYE